jgi:hypothetical protein
MSQFMHIGLLEVFVSQNFPRSLQYVEIKHICMLEIVSAINLAHRLAGRIHKIGIKHIGKLEVV